MAENFALVRLAKVLSVKDIADGDRIKVRLLPEDAGKETEVIDNVLPIIPKLLHIKPKVGEMVLILTAQATDGNSQRYYFGPVISQKNHMYYEPYEKEATSLYKGSTVSPEQAQDMIPETNGAFPKDEDISLEGRKNTGIQLTDDDVRIKAGVKVVKPGTNNREIQFNTKNPAYVKLKFNDEQQHTNKGKEYQSTALVVADKINLIGTDSNLVAENKEIKITDPDDLVTDDAMKAIIDKAHQLPYGDILVDFLKLLRTAILTHVHPFSGTPPSIVGTPLETVQNYDMNKLLSDSVRIS